MGWFNRARLSLAQFSSRRMMGRPVSRLILWIAVSPERDVQFKINELVVKPIEAQPDPGRDN